MTIHQHVNDSRGALRAAGIPDLEADLDARLLAEHLLGWTTERYFTSAQDDEPPGFAEAYAALVERRAAREPLAYITGTQEFWGLAFEVSPDVLVPRPETELIVEAALDRTVADAAVRIADVCTGSGCVGIALAHERRRATVVATDLSGRALAVARRNAARHRMEARMICVEADLLAGVSGSFDLIVSNPPYVPDGDRPSLQPEVRDHEPPLALFAGTDGLDLIRRLLVEAVPRLNAGGMLIFEFGFGQSEAVRTLVSTTPGLTLAELRQDLQAIPRTAICERR